MFTYKQEINKERRGCLIQVGNLEYNIYFVTIQDSKIDRVAAITNTTTLNVDFYLTQWIEKGMVPNIAILTWPDSWM